MNRSAVGHRRGKDFIVETTTDDIEDVLNKGKRGYKFRQYVIVVRGGDYQDYYEVTWEKVKR